MYFKDKTDQSSFLKTHLDDQNRASTGIYPEHVNTFGDI
jgi:hypothetical protein